MKTFFKSVLRALIYPAIYMAAQIIVTLLASVAAGVCYLLQNIDSATSTNRLVKEVTQYIVDFSAANLQYMLILSAVITLGTILIIFRKRRRSFAAAMALRPVRITDTVLLLLIGISLNLTSELLISLMNLPQSVLEDYQSSPVVSMLSGSLYLNILCIVLIIPFTEEVIFRGLAFNRLRSGMPIIPAFLLQAAIFAVMHFNPLQVVYVLLAGFVLGFAYLWSRSLYGSALLHAAYNCTSLILPFAAENGPNQPLLTILMYAAPAVLIAGLILLFISSQENPLNLPPKG